MPPRTFALILAAVIAAAGATVWVGWGLSAALGIDGRVAMAALPLFALAVLLLRARAARRR